MQENAISILDLAKASGVSHWTVTRALRGDVLKPRTVRKICGALQRMPVDAGFCPDPDVNLDAI